LTLLIRRGSDEKSGDEYKVWLGQTGFVYNKRFSRSYHRPHGGLSESRVFPQTISIGASKRRSMCWTRVTLALSRCFGPPGSVCVRRFNSTIDVKGVERHGTRRNQRHAPRLVSQSIVLHKPLSRRATGRTNFGTRRDRRLPTETKNNSRRIFRADVIVSPALRISFASERRSRK
jgi:hypothetical protein